MIVHVLPFHLIVRVLCHDSLHVPPDFLRGGDGDQWIRRVQQQALRYLPEDPFQKGS